MTIDTKGDLDKTLQREADMEQHFLEMLGINLYHPEGGELGRVATRSLRDCPLTSPIFQQEQMILVSAPWRGNNVFANLLSIRIWSDIVDKMEMDGAITQEDPILKIRNSLLGRYRPELDLLEDDFKYAPEEDIIPYFIGNGENAVRAFVSGVRGIYGEIYPFLYDQHYPNIDKSFTLFLESSPEGREDSVIAKRLKMMYLNLFIYTNKSQLTHGRRHPNIINQLPVLEEAFYNSLETPEKFLKLICYSDPSSQANIPNYIKFTQQDSDKYEGTLQGTLERIVCEAQFGFVMDLFVTVLEEGFLDYSKVIDKARSHYMSFSIYGNDSDDEKHFMRILSQLPFFVLKGKKIALAQNWEEGLA